MEADTKAGIAGFSPDEYSHTAKLLRSENEAVIQAALSNNLNIILAALDYAARTGAIAIRVANAPTAGGGDQLTGELSDALYELRAAIAKAEGRS